MQSFQAAVHGNNKMWIIKFFLMILKLIIILIIIYQLLHVFCITDCIKLLLSEFNLDPWVCRNRAIIAASMSEIMKLLLQDESSGPSDMNNEAIKFAPANGFEECVLFLLLDPRVDA
jgi:hypothetical protein